jgi:hypothetical protein
MPSRPRTLRESIAIAPEIAAGDSFGSESAGDTEDARVVRTGILVRVAPEIRKRLKLAAIARGTTVQQLMLEATEIALNRHEDAPAPDMKPRR